MNAVRYVVFAERNGEIVQLKELLDLRAAETLGRMAEASGTKVRIMDTYDGNEITLE